MNYGDPLDTWVPGVPTDRPKQTVASPSIDALARVLGKHGQLSEAIHEGMSAQELNGLPLNFQVAIMLTLRAEIDLWTLLADVVGEHLRS